MPNKTNTTIESSETLSLKRVFTTFLEQSEKLEQTHSNFRQQLNNLQLDLAEKNSELAFRIAEVESIKEKLSGILESITDAVFLVDSSGKPEIMNGTAAALKFDLKITSSLHEIGELSPLISSEKNIKDQDIVLNIINEKKYFMVSVLSMSKKGMTPGHKVIFLKDMTSYHELQEKLKREDRMAALGKVAASVAHEIRNPLGAIEGFAVLLERDLKDSPDKQKLASKTIYAARQLNSVVGNLLSYTREIVPRPMLCDINQLVEDSFEFVLPMADDHGVQIEKDLCRTPLTANVDPTLLSQAVMNISINAVEACPRNNGGTVTVTTLDKENSVEIRVSDNGSGIRGSKKRAIFEPFFTMKEGGTGLGLSLCKRIVEAHNGIIYESGFEGKGAIFVINLNKLEKEK